MKFQVIFSQKNNEIFKTVVCCSRDRGLKCQMMDVVANRKKNNQVKKIEKKKIKKK